MRMNQICFDTYLVFMHQYTSHKKLLYADHILLRVKQRQIHQCLVPKKQGFIKMCLGVHIIVFPFNMELFIYTAIFFLYTLLNHYINCQKENSKLSKQHTSWHYTTFENLNLNKNISSRIMLKMANFANFTSYGQFYR
jgi:hypothetical protein